MRKKEIRNTALFLIIVLALTLLLQSIFVLYSPEVSDQTATFYDLQEDTIDILFVGTSTLMVGVSPLRFWETTGITTHTRGNSAQPAQITYLNIKEGLKYQSPKLIVCSIKSLVWDYGGVDGAEHGARRGMDYKKLSVDKLKVAYAIEGDSDWQTAISYILPILKYHDRWDSLEKTDFRKSEYDYLHGQYMIFEEKEILDVSDINMANTDSVKLYDEGIYWYEKIIDLCEENDIDLLFVEFPDMRWTMGKHLAVAAFAEEHNVNFLDYNCNDIILQSGISWKSNFYNEYHLNPRGAIKATDYLAEYILKEYSIEKSTVSEEIVKQYEEDLENFYMCMNETEYVNTTE